MSGCGPDCCEDIHTLHAELIHPATDILFALRYLNNGDTAEIKDIDRRNVQAVLERYFSLAGIPVKHEKPPESKDNQNLHFTTQYEFIPDTLEVYLSGLQLNGNQSDPERDYTVDIDNKGFTIVLEPGQPHRLNSPPRQYEPLHVNYSKRIAFNTKGGT